MLISQAKLFGQYFTINEKEFKYSEGWIGKFKIRYRLTLRKIICESGEVDKSRDK